VRSESEAIGVGYLQLAVKLLSVIYRAKKILCTYNHKNRNAMLSTHTKTHGLLPGEINK
jgi:hypothetical protein